MSHSPDTPSEISRRNVLRGAAAAGLLATPAVGALAACAGGTPKKEETGGQKGPDNPFGVKDGSTVKVVVFNGGLGDEYAKKDVTIFNAKHGKVTVNLSSTQKIKTEEQPKFSTTPSDLINNSGADSMATDVLINEGAIVALDDLLDAPQWEGTGTVRESLLPGTVNDGTFQNKFYTLKYAYTVWGMWYNGAVFDKNSWQAPKTFDEFFALAPKIKAAGLAPFIVDNKHGYYPRWHILATIWKSAGKQAAIDIDNLKPNAWKADGVLAAVSAIEKIVKDKLILPGFYDHTQSQQAWLDGKAAFIQVGTWLKNEMLKTIPPGFQMKLSDYWSVSASDKAPKDVFAGAGEDWVVPAKAPNKEGAKEFLRAMLSVEAAGQFASLTSSLSSRKGSGDKVTDPALTSANEVMKNAPPDLISWKFPDFYADFDKESQNQSEELMAGRLAAQGFIDKMQATADKIAADSSIKKQTRTS